MRAKRLGLLFILAPAFCAGADEPLSPDLLEFLGSGEQLGTQWIDPMSLRETPEPFAAPTPVEKDASKRDRPEQRTDHAPQKDAPASPHDDARDDGENIDD